MTFCSLSDYLKDHDENGFINADPKNPINIFSPSLMDRKRSVETQQKHAEDLSIPIEKLVGRAALGLNDRATKLASVQSRGEVCVSNIKMISEFGCSFGVVEAASGLRHGPINFSIDWALVDPKREREPEISNTVSEVISTQEKLRFQIAAPRLSILSAGIGMATQGCGRKSRRFCAHAKRALPMRFQERQNNRPNLRPK